MYYKIYEFTNQAVGHGFMVEVEGVKEGINLSIRGDHAPQKLKYL
jgi:hypothetical protein